MFRRIFITTSIAAMLVTAATAQEWDRPSWGDQNDGTYRNPVLPSDYSDIDCIRVGSDYHAISSTFQYSPGMVILRSKDLVSWSIIGHAVNDVTGISPQLNWDRMNRYARGVWAGTLRHHAGKFRVCFGTPDEGYFMTTATNESPRELNVPLSFLPAGKHEALIIQDGPKSDHRTHAEDYLAETRGSSSADTPHLKLAPGGGACVLLVRKR